MRMPTTLSMWTRTRIPRSVMSHLLRRPANQLSDGEIARGERSTAVPWSMLSSQRLQIQTTVINAVRALKKGQLEHTCQT